MITSTVTCIWNVTKNKLGTKKYDLSGRDVPNLRFDILIYGTYKQCVNLFSNLIPYQTIKALRRFPASFTRKMIPMHPCSFKNILMIIIVFIRFLPARHAHSTTVRIIIIIIINRGYLQINLNQLKLCVIAIIIFTDLIC